MMFLLKSEWTDSIEMDLLHFFASVFAPKSSFLIQNTKQKYGFQFYNLLIFNTN